MMCDNIKFLVVAIGFILIGLVFHFEPFGHLDHPLDQGLSIINMLLFFCSFFIICFALLIKNPTHHLNNVPFFSCFLLMGFMLTLIFDYNIQYKEFRKVQENFNIEYLALRDAHLLTLDKKDQTIILENVNSHIWHNSKYINFNNFKSFDHKVIAEQIFRDQLFQFLMTSGTPDIFVERKNMIKSLFDIKHPYTKRKEIIDHD